MKKDDTGKILFSSIPKELVNYTSSDDVSEIKVEHVSDVLRASSFISNFKFENISPSRNISNSSIPGSSVSGASMPDTLDSYRSRKTDESCTIKTPSAPKADI